MKINELKPRMGKVEVVVDVIELGEVRAFNKFGTEGRVANAIVQDETGKIALTLWNEQIDLIKPGMKLEITNGYVNEFQDKMQLTTGKFGQLKVLGEGEAPAPAPEAKPDLEVTEETI